MLKKIAAWFTEPRRRAIYGLVAAGSTALVVLGIVSQEQLNQVLVTIGQVVAALSTLMAFVKTGSGGSDL